MKPIAVIILALVGGILVTNSPARSVCDRTSYPKYLSQYYTPSEDGDYYIVSSSNTYSDGTRMETGMSFEYTNWKSDARYKSHWITCLITTDPELVRNYYPYEESCYVLTAHCTIIEKTQFWEAGVKYTELKGYRSNGTLRWARDEAGSTDIYCYNSSGMSIIKRVNDPQYCK